MGQSDTRKGMRFIVQSRVRRGLGRLASAILENGRGGVSLAHIRAVGQELVTGIVHCVHEFPSLSPPALRLFIQDSQLLLPFIERWMQISKRLKDWNVLSEG
jgi:hypothetical protein